MTTYEISIADRVLRVEVRRDDGQVFVRVGDADEVRAELRSLHGALYSLTLGEQRTELAANVDRSEVRVVVDGLEYAAEVVDEAHARLAAGAGARGHAHAHLELKAPM